MSPEPEYARSCSSDIIMKGTLRKAKSWNKRFFVLREGTPPVLEYYENEKKWRMNKIKRTIEISKPWNICRKRDVKHDHLIMIFTEDNYFSMAADNADIQERWLSALERIVQPEPGRALFQNVWHVALDNKELIPVGDSKHYLLTGPFRCCLKHDGVVLVRVNTTGGRDRRCEPIEVAMPSIRMCGYNNNCFFFEAGRSSGIGQGKLWMEVNDDVMACQMYEIVYSLMCQNGHRNRAGSSGSQSHPRHHNPPPKWIGLGRSNNTSRSRCQSLPASQPYFNDGTMRCVRTSSEGEHTMKRPPTHQRRTCRMCSPGARCAQHRGYRPPHSTPAWQQHPGIAATYQMLQHNKQELPRDRLPHESTPNAATTAPGIVGSSLTNSSNSSNTSSSEQLYTAMSFSAAAAAPVSSDQHPISLLSSHSDCIDEQQLPASCLGAAQRCFAQRHRSLANRLCKDCLAYINVVGSHETAPPPPDVQPSSLKTQQQQLSKGIHVRAASFDGVIPQSPDSLSCSPSQQNMVSVTGDHRRASMQAASYSPEPVGCTRQHQRRHGANNSQPCTPISTSPKRVDGCALIGSDDEGHHQAISFQEAPPVYPHQFSTTPEDATTVTSNSKKVAKQYSSSSLHSLVQRWLSPSSASPPPPPPPQETTEASAMVAPGYVPMRPQQHNNGGSAQVTRCSKPRAIIGSNKRRSSVSEARGVGNLSSSGEQQQQQNVSSLHHKPRSGTVTSHFNMKLQPGGVQVVVQSGQNNNNNDKKIVGGGGNAEEYLEMQPLNAVENKQQKQKERSAFLLSSANRRKNSSVGFEIDSSSKKKLPPQYPHQQRKLATTADSGVYSTNSLDRNLIKSTTNPYKQQQQQQRGSKPRSSASFSISGGMSIGSPQRSHSIRIPTQQPQRHISTIRTVALTTNQTPPRNESSNSDEYVDIMIKPQQQQPRTGSAPGVRSPLASVNDARVGANSR